MIEQHTDGYIIRSLNIYIFQNIFFNMRIFSLFLHIMEIKCLLELLNDGLKHRFHLHLIFNTVLAT